MTARNMCSSFGSKWCSLPKGDYMSILPLPPNIKKIRIAIRNFFSPSYFLYTGDLCFESYLFFTFKFNVKYLSISTFS